MGFSERARRITGGETPPVHVKWAVFKMAKGIRKGEVPAPVLDKKGCRV